jgi:hypothetical protein
MWRLQEDASQRHPGGRGDRQGWAASGNYASGERGVKPRALPRPSARLEPPALSPLAPSALAFDRAGPA